MRTAVLSVSLISLALLWVPVAMGGERKDLYDESADGRRQIASALEKANNEGKRVLIVWGANWCGWCHHLEEQCNTDPKIKTLLKNHYISIHLDLGHRDKHMDLAREYGLDFDNLYIPHMSVLDRKGKSAGEQLPGDLSVPSGDRKIYSQPRIAAFLERHKGEKELSKGAPKNGLAN